MDDAMDAVAHPSFRPVKRRKIVSRKALEPMGLVLEGGGDDEPQRAPSADTADSVASATLDDGGENDQRVLPNRVRRQRKHGVTFTNTPPPLNLETALTIVPEQESEVAESQNARFVKPTGKATVTDDKHMSAFIDSKLAEMKANAQVLPHQSAGTDAIPDNSNGRAMRATMDPTVAPGAKSQPTAVPVKADQAARNRQRRRREPRPPSPTQVARDNLIEQILSESQSANPHYEPLSANPTPPPQTTDGSVDNDTLAAMQFKAEFLAAAEERNLMRRPPANPGQAMGPKLGGSRAARDRMKVAEEAAAEAAKGKK